MNKKELYYLNRGLTRLGSNGLEESRKQTYKIIFVNNLLEISKIVYFYLARKSCDH